MSLIPARLKDKALVAEMDQLRSVKNELQVWWLGQSGYLIQWNGHRALIDPYLSDALSIKYATTDKPHVRMSEQVVDPHLLSGIEVVTSSHNHTDHLCADTLKPILEHNPGISFIIPEANRQFVAKRVACDDDFPTGLNAGQSTQAGVFTFHAVPAAHNALDRDEKGNHLYLGYVIEVGPWKIYHSGDTLWYESMVETLQPFDVDLALLPINGNDPARRVAGNLSCSEAAELGRAIGADWVIPCHYDMFAFNTADPADFVKAATQIGQPHQVLEHGGLVRLRD
jgi:L-ascorbate metabolism protein UlaG (beta-lactamase superfamily)